MTPKEKANTPRQTAHEIQTNKNEVVSCRFPNDRPVEIPCPTCQTFPISLWTSNKFQFTCAGTRKAQAKNI